MFNSQQIRSGDYVMLVFCLNIFSLELIITFSSLPEYCGAFLDFPWTLSQYVTKPGVEFDAKLKKFLPKSSRC